MFEIWTGFALGLMGSFHCLGMCGPLVIAVPHRRQGSAFALADGIIYNLSKAAAYALMGALAGLLGAALALSGLQEKVSIVLGSLILIFLIFPRIKRIIPGNKALSRIINSRLKPKIIRLMNPKTIPALMTLGFLNGFLPCGLVYIALTAAMASGSVLGGSLHMAFFGLGTLPMMSALFYLKKFIGSKIRSRIYKFAPAGVAVIAFLLILRGLALGIPYISPDLPDHVKPVEKRSVKKVLDETPPCCK